MGNGGLSSYFYTLNLIEEFFLGQTWKVKITGQSQIINRKKTPRTEVPLGKSLRIPNRLFFISIQW